MALTKPSAEKTAGAERRRFFRINDRIALAIRVLDEDELSDLLVKYETGQYQRNLLSQFAHDTEKRLPELRIIEKRYPSSHHTLNSWRRK